jgi:tRNA (guanine37-N1)-methyltransferase
MLDYVPRSFDILGSRDKAVAIIDIPEELDDYRAEVGIAITRVHGNVESVLSRESGREGRFRVRDLEVIYGDTDTEVIHKESGCRLKLDPQVTYFSPRESTERERIVSKVESGEDILVMFSGIGPLPICITKKVADTTATAIELNPWAHRYCIENIELNKVKGKVNAILGDVREVCPSFKKDFDRVLMPLPKGAYKYLDVAIPTLKRGGVIHFYHWAPEEDLWSEGERLIDNASRMLRREATIIDRQTVSQYSPRVYKIRLDARID